MSAPGWALTLAALLAGTVPILDISYSFRMFLEGIYCQASGPHQALRVLPSSGGAWPDASAALPGELTASHDAIPR